jgi:VIT1/CCC1 family predicted Fe2+/Mn2+ transporter
MTRPRSERKAVHDHRYLAAGALVSKERDHGTPRLRAPGPGPESEWKAFSGLEVAPAWWRVGWYSLISRVLGFTFAVKLMECGEADAAAAYRAAGVASKRAEALAREEDEHEQALLGLLDEERLRYAGSIVLGLNDALVELTGALAGLTFALQNTRLIALTGTITGLAAALSMAASEYLSTRTEETARQPVKAATYTGIAYLLTVVLLVSPYLLLASYRVALACTMLIAVLIIASFNYYISVAKDLPFKRRFLEMAGLSFGVAATSFLIGLVLRKVLGVEI